MCNCTHCVSLSRVLDLSLSKQGAREINLSAKKMIKRGQCEVGEGSCFNGKRSVPEVFQCFCLKVVYCMTTVTVLWPNSKKKHIIMK